MTWIYDDGGRKAARFKGEARDCVCRAIAIAAELPYADVYRDLNDYCKIESQCRGKRGLSATLGRGSSSRTGIIKQTSREYIAALGWTWTPTMFVGKGCQVHLRPDELPSGRLIVSVSRHVVAVIDGVIHDTHDCSRDGKRCVYGYWFKPVTS